MVHYCIICDTAVNCARGRPRPHECYCPDNLPYKCNRCRGEAIAAGAEVWEPAVERIDYVFVDAAVGAAPQPPQPKVNALHCNCNRCERR